MKLEGRYTLPAPPDKVWALLTDPQRLAKLLPGCERLDPDGPDRFKAVVKFAIAAISGKYAGTLEFADKNPPHKDEALRAFDRTIAMVVGAIRKHGAEDWSKAYTAEREPEARDRFGIFVRCAGHAYHHVGQIVYLTRELART
jgi:hypothetical protein